MFCECGTGSFKHVDEDIGCGGGISPPKVGRKKHGGGKVNPYAERGLDRFSVVLSELECRRAKILRRVGSSDTGLVMIRFVQSDGGWAPVVFKLPEEPFVKGAKKRVATASASPAARPAASNSATPPEQLASPRANAATARTKLVAPARRASSFSWGTMRRPLRYWPAVIVLTLVSLAVFGRVFAICLTSVWWYVLPTLSSAGCSDYGAGAGRRSMQKKKHVSLPLQAGVHELVSSPRCNEKGKRG